MESLNYQMSQEEPSFIQAAATVLLGFGAGEPSKDSPRGKITSLVALLARKAAVGFHANHQVPGNRCISNAHYIVAFAVINVASQRASGGFLVA